MTKHKVTILPNHGVIEVDEATNLLDALRRNDIYIKSSCGGVASCSDCVIKIKSGADYLNSPSFEEEKLLGNVFHITKERLSCQTKVCGDVTIDVSVHNKAKDQEKLLSKTNKFIKKKQSAQAPEKKLDPKQDDSWNKHWEKEKQTGPKRFGGGKRPKPFKTDSSED